MLCTLGLTNLAETALRIKKTNESSRYPDFEVQPTFF